MHKLNDIVKLECFSSFGCMFVHNNCVINYIGGRQMLSMFLVLTNNKNKVHK